MRRFRVGDEVRFRPLTTMRPSLKDEVGRVVEIEPHPLQKGPIYRVWIQFPRERAEGVFAYELELVKAAPD